MCAFYKTRYKRFGFYPLLFILLLLVTQGALLPGFCLGVDKNKTKKIDVHFYHIDTNYGFKITEAVEVFKAAQNKIKNELGIRLRLTKIKVLKQTPFEFIESLDLASRQFELLGAKKFLSKRERGKRALSIINRGPIIVGDTYWFTGIASSVCNPRGIGLLFTGPKSSTGESRIKVSEVIMAHEIGHLLGASHEAFTIMDADALTLVKSGFNLYFSDRAERMVGTCLKKN